MPAKPKRPKSPDAQFLFVNEDASTVTRATKDAELDRTKQSHVQRQNFARKRRLREQSISGPQTRTQSSSSQSPATADPPNEVASPSQGGPSHAVDYFNLFQSVDLGDAQFQATSQSFLQSSPLDPQLSTIPSDPFVSVASSPAIFTRSSSVFDLPHSYHPGHFFDTTTADFSVNPTPRESMTVVSPSPASSRVSSPLVSSHRILEQWAPPLIQHYNTVVLPEMFWKDIQKVPMGRIRHARSIHTDMQACMSEPAHMYAFLAMAAAEMLAREGGLRLPNLSAEDCQRVPEFFKTKAVQALRVKLASGPLDYRFAVDLHRVYASELALDNHEAAETHLQTWFAMVDTLGGLNTFDEYQLEKMIMLDCTAALKLLGVPRLLSNWDPGPLPSEILANIESQGQYNTQAGTRMDTVFQTLDSSQMMDDTFSDAFSDLVEVLGMSMYLHNLHEYVPEHYKWLSRRTLSVLHRLLSLPLHREMNDKTDSLRIATIYWTALLRSPIRARRAASKSNHTLKMRLEGTGLENLWRPHTDCLLWVVVFGGICTTDQDDLYWYLHIANRAATELGVSNAVELEESLSRLLYDPVSQRDMLFEFAARMWPAGDSESMV